MDRLQYVASIEDVIAERQRQTVENGYSPDGLTKKPAVSGLTMICATNTMPVSHPPCAVCGTPYDKHGSYPTCASHPYTPGVRVPVSPSAGEPSQ